VSYTPVILSEACSLGWERACRVEESLPRLAKLLTLINLTGY